MIFTVYDHTSNLLTNKTIHLLETKLFLVRKIFLALENYRIMAHLVAKTPGSVFQSTSSPGVNVD